MTPEQKEAIERANAALSGMSRGGGTEKPTGFFDTQRIHANGQTF